MAVQRTHHRMDMRFLGGSSQSAPEVHDLRKAKQECRIAGILRAGQAVRFIPDSIDEAHKNGYGSCVHCIGEMTGREC